MPETKRAMRQPLPLRLGVNIDHVATIRNARGGRHPDPLRAAYLAVEAGGGRGTAPPRGGRHPDPLRAAYLAVEAGADGITAHLREDRRHISDQDIARLKSELTRPLN